MCNPAAIAGLQAFQTIVQYQQGKKDARSLQEAATAAYENDKVAQQLQNQQILDASRQEITQRAKSALIERSRLRTAAGESGTVGSSVNRVIQQPNQDAGFDIAAMVGNRESRTMQAHLERQASYARYKSRLNQATPPSPLVAGLQIAGIGADYYTKTHTPKSKSP